MKRNSIYTLIIALVLLFFTVKTQAQEGNVINFMQTVPQSNVNNPALNPSVGFYIGLPSFYLGLDNANFAYNNVISKRNLPKPYDSSYIDVDKFLGTLDKTNKLSYEGSIQLFALGFKVQKSYFTLSLSNKFTTNFNFTKDLMTFILKGNESFIGQNANIGDSKFGLNNYMEAALGFSREINKNLTVGLRFKYLVGVVNIYTERSSINIYTDPNTYALSASSDVFIRTSSPVDKPYDSLSNIKPGDLKWKDLMNQNKGIAFDFGGEYKINNKLAIGLSVIDLGYIDWSSNVNNIQSKNPNNKFDFAGIQIDSAFSNGGIGNDAFNKIVDSLKSVMGIQEVKGTKYRAPLKTKIYFSASYFLTKSDRFGLVVRNDIINQAVNTSVTVSYNRYFGKNISLTFANTMVAESMFNPGGGIAVNVLFGQLYFLVDHSSSFYAADIKNLGFQFGLNLVFGKTKPGKRDDAAAAKAEEEERSSKKKRLMLEPTKTDTVIVKPTIVPTPKMDTSYLRTIPIKTKIDTIPTTIDTLKKAPVLRMMDTTIVKPMDSLQGALKVDTTTNKLAPFYSTKSIKESDAIPAVKKVEETIPTNPTPAKEPEKKEPFKATQNAAVPDETKPIPKQ